MNFFGSFSQFSIKTGVGHHDYTDTTLSFLDISGFFLRRGMKQGEKNFDAYESDMKEKREAVFNYPLFLGLLYLIVAAVVAYTVL